MSLCLKTVTAINRNSFTRANPSKEEVEEEEEEGLFDGEAGAAVSLLCPGRAAA